MRREGGGGWGGGGGRREGGEGRGKEVGGRGLICWLVCQHIPTGSPITATYLPGPRKLELFFFYLFTLFGCFPFFIPILFLAINR